MADINLLPEQQQSKGYVTKVGASAKKYGTYVAVLLIIAAVIYGGIYGFFYISSTVSISSTEKLENEIKALESTEQKIVLLRDRLSKSGKVLASDSADDESLSFIDINANLPEGVEIQSSTLSASGFTVRIKSDRSQQVGEFIRSLVNSKKYAQIELASMDFNPKDRYLSEIKLRNLETN